MHTIYKLTWYRFVFAFNCMYIYWQIRHAINVLDLNTNDPMYRSCMVDIETCVNFTSFGWVKWPLLIVFDVDIGKCMNLQRHVLENVIRKPSDESIKIQLGKVR